MSGAVRRLVRDIPPLMMAYLLFQAALGLFLDFAWISHPYGNPMLLPGVLLAINGSMIAPKLDVWRTLPVTAREIDRARWWHSLGAPCAMLGLLMAASVLTAMALDTRNASWRDIGLSWGGQCAVCVIMALVWMAMPLARRKWGRWSGLIVLPLLLLYFHIVVGERGDLRPSLEMVIPAAILAATILYAAAGHWPLPGAIWTAPSGHDFWNKGGEAPSRQSGWPVLLRANLGVWLWIWGLMAFGCLALKYFMPHFNLALFGWIFGLMSAQVLVSNLTTAMRVFRALPLSGGRLTSVLVLLLLCVQGLSLSLFRLVLQIAGDTMPVPAFVAPLIFPLLYFPAAMRFGMRVAQLGYALAIIVLAPLQLMTTDAANAPVAVAGLLLIASVAVVWIWREIAHGHRAYGVQPLVPARWRGVD